MVVPSRYRATAYGILNSFACIVGGVSVYVGGALRDSGVSVARVFQFGAGIIVICVVLLRRIIMQANVKLPLPLPLRDTFPTLAKYLLIR